VGGGGGVSKVSYYRGVRGSRALATHALGAPAPAEALEPGEMRRVAFAGELLGAVRVRSSFAAIPLDVFDRASAELEAEEQAAYLHLLRLSVAEGRNWCRLAKKDLMDRLRLSERRLLRVLAALVEKRYLRPLDRDNRGTLWRVYLPREAAGEPLGDDVLLGRAAELRVVRAPPQDAGRPATPAIFASEPSAPSPCLSPGVGEERSKRSIMQTRRPRPVETEASLARALADARGRADPEGLALALREVRELLTEGQPPERIAACIETVRRRARRPGAGDPP
jgi:hypothetical protein